MSAMSVSELGVIGDVVDKENTDAAIGATGGDKAACVGGTGGDEAVELTGNIPIGQRPVTYLPSLTGVSEIDSIDHIWKVELKQIRLGNKKM